jgi:hypothetical protein
MALVHGALMTTVLLCTGKKKKIREVLDYYKGLQNKRFIDILSVRSTTKRALFWNYDELKILFEVLEPDQARPPEKLLKTLDTHAFREQAMILLDCKTKRTPDEMLKVKVLTTCGAHIARGVRAQVEQEELRESEYRIYYRCAIQLKGPVSAVVACKDNLVAEDLCDTDSVGYIF